MGTRIGAVCGIEARFSTGMGMQGWGDGVYDRNLVSGIGIGNWQNWGLVS